MPWYEKAEAELGVSGDVEEHSFAGMTFPRATPTRCRGFHRRFSISASNETLAQLTEDETKSLEFLGTATPVTELRVRSLPAARNSQPYRNRRACAGNTSCIPICPIQAKYDPTITLNEATNSGAKLMDHAVASEILVENNRRQRNQLYHVQGRGRTEDGEWLRQGQDLRHCRQRHRDAAALADVKK